CDLPRPESRLDPLLDHPLLLLQVARLAMLLRHLAAVDIAQLGDGRGTPRLLALGARVLPQGHVAQHSLCRVPRLLQRDGSEDPNSRLTFGTVRRAIEHHKNLLAVWVSAAWRRILQHKSLLDRVPATGLPTAFASSTTVLVNLVRAMFASSRRRQVGGT